MPAEPGTRRFRVGDVPPLAEGFTDRPDTARGIVDAVVPGASVALVPGSAFAEGPQNWLGACGKTQIAVIIAESLWRSAAIDILIWVNATSRASVLSGFVEASVASSGIEPTGTAESIVARFVSWLSATSQQWLVVFDDLPDSVGLDGLWPEGPAGRVLATSPHSAVIGRRGTQVMPVGFFSVREALNCLTERLSVNPAQRHGAIDLIEALGREPLALAHASAGVANSTLACRGDLDAVPGAGGVAAAGRLGPGHAGLRRPPRRSRYTGIDLQHAGRGRLPRRSRDPVLDGGRPEARLGRAARHRAGRPDHHQPG